MTLCGDTRSAQMARGTCTVIVAARDEMDACNSALHPFLCGHPTTCHVPGLRKPLHYPSHLLPQTAVIPTCKLPAMVRR